MHLYPCHDAVREISYLGHLPRWIRQCLQYYLKQLHHRWFETGKKSENDPANFDSAKLRLTVARGPHQGVVADFYVNRSSDCDVRTIAVDFARVTNPCNRSVVVPESSYVVSLSYYTSEGEVVHIPDSLDNEHRFFLKLLAGACADWGHRAAQNAADCVKFASEQ